MKLHVAWIIICLCQPLFLIDAVAEKIRITQKKSGKTIAVEDAVLKGDIVSFRHRGKTYKFPLNTLTDESVERIKVVAKAKPQKKSGGKVKDLTGLNKKIGVTLFKPTSSIWNEDAADVAGRLKWPAESEMKSTSYRYYPPKDYTFLGAHPYCATLYASPDGKGDRLSLVFANKGDYGSTSGVGPDHFKKVHPGKEMPKSLQEAIDFDADTIKQSLVQAIGDEPEKQYYGEKEDKRKVLRWDAGDHAFLLTSIDKEVTSLLIVSKENADLQGKVKMIKDSELKAKVAQNVTREVNGDIYIKGIPMVNQGPKGYCAPATFERAMSYMHIPADMYLLAIPATTEGGGTNTRILSDSCKRIVRSKARKIRDMNLKEDLNLKLVKKFIDNGVPILWQMRSLKQYNDLANSRSEKRKKIEDFMKWEKEIKAEADAVAPGLENIDDKHHICMIIGYNELTNEVAVSDSWGPRYALRWVHLDIVKAVTSRGGFVIDF